MRGWGRFENVVVGVNDDDDVSAFRVFVEERRFGQFLLTNRRSATYISPLNPQLPPSLLSRSIFQQTPIPYPPLVSYHNNPHIFREAYGFTTIPVPLVEKIKKRLHGTIFKDVKVQV